MPRQSDTAYYTIAGIYVAEGVRSITSADKFYGWLRETPNYVPRRIARDVWNQYKSQDVWSDYRDRMDADAPLLRRFFSDVDALHSQAYNVKIRYTGIDPATEEELESYVILGFDQPPTLSTIEQWALAQTDYHPPLPAGAIISWGIEYMYHRRDKPW